jgi:diguanylate cyclase (GGDEF)-like protein
MNASSTLTPPVIAPPAERDAARYCQGLERLVAVVQRLSFCRTVDDVVAIVRRAARELTGADGAAVILNDAGFCHYVGEDAIGPLWKGQRFPLHACISGWVIRNKRAVVIEDVFTDPRVPAQAYRATFVKSLAVVPIRSLDPVGAIGTYWASHRTPTANEVQLLRALADTTAVALENARIYSELEQRVRDRTRELEAEVAERRRAEGEVRQLSLTDDLTGLHNRRGFLLLAEQEWKVARRAGVSCALVYADLDRLKETNDTYGQEAGDCLIRDAGRVLRATFRDADVVARLGGDEFVVFALACPPDAAAVRARLLTRCEELNRQAGRRAPLAMSIGVVPCDPGAALNQLLARGDEAMYREKRARKAVR